MQLHMHLQLGSLPQETSLADSLCGKIQALWAKKRSGAALTEEEVRTFANNIKRAFLFT